MVTKAIILARGGSKRIPGKNLIHIKGRPLLSFVVDAAKSCSHIQETWVSTNCSHIKEVALCLGCKVLDRPDRLSSDTSQSEEALLHFVENVECDRFVFIQPTSPLLTASDLDKGFALLQEGYDSAFSVRLDHWEPKWTSTVTPEGWDITDRPRSQDVEVSYVENGAFYITSKTLLETTKSRYGVKKGMVEMPTYRSFQIDTEEDLVLMEKLL